VIEMGETLNETVKLILCLSISGGLFALALFVLKPFVRNRLSKSFQYYIWLVVLLRFIVPFTFGTNLMDFMLNTPNALQSAEETVIPNNDPANPANANPAITDNPVNNNAPDISEQQQSTPIKADSAQPFDLVKTLTDNCLWIWLAGMAVSLAFNLLGYLRFMRYIHGAAVAAEIPDCGAKVYKSRFAPTPMLVGVIRPRIYLPDIEYTDEQLDNILRHELTHLRRRDVWMKWFVTLVVSVHWFNPVVYFMRREINRACEMSCDEAVIRDLDSAAKQSYSDTLISVAAESRYPVGVMSTTMCEEKKTLKERLVAIMSYKKKTKIAILITAVLAIGITGSAFAFGAGIPLFQPTYYEAKFPYEHISDISTEDMTTLILNMVKHSGADIYMFQNPQNIHFNPDWTLRDFTAQVLISEHKNGVLMYRPYQIRIFPEERMIRIYPWDTLEPADTRFRYDPFISYWDALIYLPINAMEEVAEGARAIGRPYFYSLQYDTHVDQFSGIFYNKNGVLDTYRPSPSAAFVFFPMVKDTDNPNSYTGINCTSLYYYADSTTQRMNVDLTNNENENNTVIPLYTARLTHDGSVQTIELEKANEFSYILRVADMNGKTLWETSADTPHTGWNALFLTHIDGKDYLMQYNPTMYQGGCTYYFRVFSLDKDGKELLLDEGDVDFGINPPGGSDSFRRSDIEPVKAFFEHVNQYLPSGYLLVNTDDHIGRLIPGGASYSTQDAPITGLRDYFFESADLSMSDQMELFIQDYTEQCGAMED